MPIPIHLMTLLALVLQSIAVSFGQDSLLPLKDGKAPETRAELWAAYDPRREPLEVEILKAWEEDGVVLEVLRYRVGLFKGQKAMIAAIFGHPKGARNLPGLVQIHGGGQYADHQAVLTNAKRGYATISVSWAGRISAPGYRVGPDEVKRFWNEATDHPQYKITTDWGALDGYHAPSRNPGNVFPMIPKPAPWTLDAVKSPRNNAWFLATLAARRALTFLEKQPEVEASRLGVYGHSMGGKITVLTAGSDKRVKAAATSCGGISDRTNKDPLFRATLGDDAYLRNLQCPVVFLSPSNDFHGRIHDLQTALTEIPTNDWRITCSPHHNHQDTPPFEVATQLWFDQHLKGTFHWPETPDAQLNLQARHGIPTLTVTPDASRKIASVNVFYTQDANPEATREAVINRVWNHAPAVRNDDTWTARLPVASANKPLWAYANVAYTLKEPLTGAGYYYRTYSASEFNVSSRMLMVEASALEEARVEETLKPTIMIESFENDWKKEWFTYRADQWPLRTHRVNEPRRAAPTGAKLSLQVRSDQPNRLVIGIDGYATEFELEGGDGWQTILASPHNFTNARGRQLESWKGIRELRLADQETVRARRPDATRKLGATWKGEAPAFRDLKWVPLNSPFMHPGISHTKAGLNRVKSRISKDSSPWAEIWQKIQQAGQAGLERRPQPHVRVERGPYNNPDIGSSDFSRDANAAYIQALLWALTEKPVHAKKAAEILDAWSGTLNSISNHDARLLIGMEGYEFCNAAELLKHTWDGWPRTAQDRFEAMLRQVFYPVIKDFYPSANGNWDASMLQTMLAMGVYLDDRAMFDRAVDYYLNGPGNGAVHHYFFPSGQCQETGRDQAHTQMGLDFLACSCEITWNQGLDLYSAFDNRLMRGFEYTAKYNLGFDVPYEPYRSFEGRYHYKTISEKARGRLRPMFEKVLNHYQNREGYEAPFTRWATMKLREDSGEGRRAKRRRTQTLIGWLMFADQPDTSSAHP